MRFTKFTADGFPFCPACGEEELYSHVIRDWDGLSPRPTEERVMLGNFTCYACHWTGNGRTPPRGGSGVTKEKEQTAVWRPLDGMQREVGEWAEKTFPKSDLLSIARHLEEECGEFADAVIHPNMTDNWPITRADDEAADILLLLLHYAHKRRISLAYLTERKFAEVQQRTWDDGSERGYSRHVPVYCDCGKEALACGRCVDCDAAAYPGNYTLPQEANE